MSPLSIAAMTGVPDKAEESVRSGWGAIDTGGAVGPDTSFCWTRAKFLERRNQFQPQTLKFPGNFREICYHR